MHMKHNILKPNLRGEYSFYGENYFRFHIRGQKVISPSCSGNTMVPSSVASVRTKNKDLSIPDPSGSSCSLWAWEGVCGRERTPGLAEVLKYWWKWGHPCIISSDIPMGPYLLPDHSLCFFPAGRGVGLLITPSEWGSRLAWYSFLQCLCFSLPSKHRKQAATPGPK